MTLTTQQQADDLAHAIVAYFTGTAAHGQATLLSLAQRYLDARRVEAEAARAKSTLPTLPPSDYVGGLAGLAKREAGR
jgi:hypothetical protein